jgi:hypothetical protein
MEDTARQRRKQESDTKEYETMIEQIRGECPFTLDNYLHMVK